MGLLDEAIREHLDLKRRRGADPSEVERLEREALGPVRRAPHDVPDAMMDEDPVTGSYPSDEEVSYGPDEVPEWRDSPAERAPFDHGGASPADTRPPADWDEYDQATEIAPPPERDYEPDRSERVYEAARHHEIAEEWEAHERRGAAAEPAGFEPDEPAPAPPAPGPVFGGERQRPVRPEDYDLELETMEHDVEAEELAHPDDHEPAEGEDMLEETPDFLQDTPDHDRLWFEQRPPRDFDFDG